jgi:predicted ribosomally synthesized peptide with nif11-like leader
MSIQHVKAFYEKLSQDEVFRDRIKNVNSKEECSRIVKAAGYDFTQQEFEDYTEQLLEKDPTDDDLIDIGERELEAVHGGYVTGIIINGIDIGNLMAYGLPPRGNPFTKF